MKAREFDSVANYERKRNLYFLLYCAKVEGEQRHISLALIACGTAVAHDTGAMSLGTSVRPDPSHWRGSAPGGKAGPCCASTEQGKYMLLPWGGVKTSVISFLRVL